MARVFLSYRRKDQPYAVEIVRSRIQARLGENAVFRDTNDIPPGADFRQHIADALANCKVCLVFIGDDWLTATDSHGKRRLDNPEDPVRVEIETALRCGLRVIPVLVDEATVPNIDQLPPSLAALVSRNATELRSAADLSEHVEALIDSIQGRAPARTKRMTERRLPYKIAVFVLALAVTLLVTIIVSIVAGWIVLVNTKDDALAFAASFLVFGIGGLAVLVEAFIIFIKKRR